MLLPFSFRVAEWPPVLERAVHSVKGSSHSKVGGVH